MRHQNRNRAKGIDADSLGKKRERKASRVKKEDELIQIDVKEMLKDAWEDVREGRLIRRTPRRGSRE